MLVNHYVDLISETVRYTLALLDRASEHFSLTLHPVDIRFDLRGKAAGMVRFATSGPPIIRYNRMLLESYPTYFITQTVPHEVAHVVVAALYPFRTAPHGSEWRQVMFFFGAEPKRCHALPVSGTVVRRVARFSYRCACREHSITSIRHNRIARGERYYCRHCSMLLQPV